MSLHNLISSQQLPISVEQAWDFISSPKNLKIITPDYMGFEIKGIPPADKMYSGMIISYSVKPILSIPLNWVTEITHVKELEYFVDEQRFGPYSFWHHKHFIKPIDGGVQMDDLVHYRLPLGPLGNLANALIVRRQLNEIFDYRFKKLEELFGKMPSK